MSSEEIINGITSFKAINYTTSVLTANITVTPHYSNGSVTCDGNSKQVTIKVYAITPDVNAGLVNALIPGNVSTNDVVPSGTTYGTPIGSLSNPSTSLPSVNGDGSYTFSTITPGVYSFDVPVCVPGGVTPCPTTSLTITVTDPALGNNPPVAKTDIATTAFVKYR